MIEKCTACDYFYKIYDHNECKHPLSRYNLDLAYYLSCQFMISSQGYCGENNKLFKKKGDLKNEKF